MNNSKVNNKDVFDMSWIQKDTRCWIYQPNQHDHQIYLKGFIKAIVPLSINKANSRVSGMTQNGMTFQAKAHQLERCRDSNSIQRDLIEMDVINAPEVLLQLKRRLLDSKIHTCLWNSIIITNPFKLIPEQYSQKSLSTYFQYIFLKGDDIRKHEPHIFSFMFEILGNLYKADRTQVICISGESGSGKTETNKQALRAISYCSGRVQNLRTQKAASNLQDRVLQCDPILQVFGNAKTIKNDNSSRFGKLITLRIDRQTIKIYHSIIKNYFLEKSRIISQSNGERNFHVFYLLLTFASEQLKSSLFMRSNNGIGYKAEDFTYLSQRIDNKQLALVDKQMWDNLLQAFTTLQFSKQTIFQIWSIVSSILLIGNIKFDQTMHSENEPCQIKNYDLVVNVSSLLGLDKKQFAESLVMNKRTIAGQLVLSCLTGKQCIQGRDSMAKALYESLFQWLVQDLNKRLNISNQNEKQSQIIKLLDIYGFEVFDHNSFQQLCVNYTNEKIHQIYLQQVFIHEKNTLKKQGLEHIISKLNFTDNIKIIELIDSYSKSIFNLLDQSCSVNVKDDDFLANIRKHHDQNEHFPPSNNVNLRKSFIIRHTPGDIQYMAQGFRDKNKDLIREDIVNKLSKSKVKIVAQGFKERLQILKVQTNKKFLGVKIRRQVKQLILQMSTNTDLHFIRCIKPNEQRKPFTFIDRVCYNQIKYLGILDTIQMRKESYHIRMPYAKFYQKYGIIQHRIDKLIDISQGKIPFQIKDVSMQFITNYFVNYNIDYQFGKERIFLKMATQNLMDNILKLKTKDIQLSSTIIKVHYRRYLMSKRRKQILNGLQKMQRNIKAYLRRVKAQKKKRAVIKIQNAWIACHDLFFIRKKRPKIMNIQRFIKTSLDAFRLRQKIESVRRAKFLLVSMAYANRQAQKIENYRMIKNDVKGYLYDTIWDKMTLSYKNKIDTYFKGSLVLRNNQKMIAKAEETTIYRLNIKYKGYLETYLRGYIQYKRVQVKLKAILTIQSCFKMFRVKNEYQKLRNQVIRIQRNWKKYHYDKKFNLKFTEQYFKSITQDSNIIQETYFWKSLLYRDFIQSSKNKAKGVQSLLFNNERIKSDKIGLFYYMLDFQILSDISQIYPNYSWGENYYTLYEQCWQKGNPIQILQVSDENTVCTTLSKVYQWGNYKLQDLISKDENKFKLIKPIKTPSTKIQKIYAHNKFTIVEMQNEEPVINGNQEYYNEDCSNKEWKTLREVYVLLNGIIIMLKKTQFSKIQITEKVAQLSCGMNHCIARTSLKKVFTWGDNSKGQLGLGHFRRVNKPKMLDFINKNAITVQQVAASAYGNMVLDTNSRIWWWGSNGTIKEVCTPRECLLYEKSQFIDDPQKYTVVRILSTWSKSLSIIGVTLASHNNIFKSSQNNIKKKTFQNLISKWNTDIKTVTPPYVQTISGYFQEKYMPKSNQVENKNISARENQRIRERLLAEINLMQETQRTLLKQRKRL